MELVSLFAAIAGPIKVYWCQVPFVRYRIDKKKVSLVALYKLPKNQEEERSFLTSQVPLGARERERESKKDPNIREDCQKSRRIMFLSRWDSNPGRLLRKLTKIVGSI